LELDTLEFGGSLTTLGTMETQVTGPLTDFSNILRNVCSVLRDKINSEDIEYVSNIREYIGYCQAVKDVLKLRDQKQVDFEELSQYLQNHIAERDRTLNPQRGGGGLASFFSSKYQELKGVDVEKARQTKLQKLSSKITEVT
jgi:sorting nexin-4